MNNFQSILTNILQGNTRTTQALQQISISLILKGISIVISLVYVPLLLNYLSETKYGIWLTLTSIMGWLSIFDIGLGNGLRNKLTEAIAEKNYELGKKYVSTTYFMLILIFGTLFIIFQIVNPYLNWNKILNANNIANSELYLLSTIVFSFIVIQFIVQIISVIFFAYQKPSSNSLITTSANVLSFILVFLLVHSSIQENLVLLGSIISAIPVLLFLIASIIMYKGKFKHIRPSIKYIDLKLSPVLMNLGVKFFFLQICSLIIFSTSSFFIAQFYGPSEVTVYNISFKLFQMPIMLYSIILSPMWSAVTDAYAQKDFIWLNKTIKQTNILSILFIVGILLLLVLSEWIYGLWIGDVVKIPFELSAAMALYAIMNIFVAPYSYFINGTGKIKLTTLLTGLGIGIYLILIYVFKNVFSNSLGVILAIIATSIIGTTIQPMQTHKILKGTAKGMWDR